MTALKRVRQFLAAVSPAGDSAVPEIELSPAEWSIFERLSPPFRDHSRRVLGRLLADGERDPYLLRAALLHDVGKSTARIGTAHRVIHVLLARIAPGAWQALANESATGGWRQPFHVQAHHAAIGAALLRDAGSSTAVVALVAKHHDAPSTDDSPQLRALRRADGDE